MGAQKAVGTAHAGVRWKLFSLLTAMTPSLQCRPVNGTSVSVRNGWEQVDKENVILPRIFEGLMKHTKSYDNYRDGRDER